MIYRFNAIVFCFFVFFSVIFVQATFAQQNVSNRAQQNQLNTQVGPNGTQQTESNGGQQVESNNIQRAESAQRAESNSTQRIKKVKAYIAVGNCSAASYELEKMRRENQDEMHQSFGNSILIGCYTDQRDYKRAQKMIEDAFQSASTPSGAQNYLVLAAQVIKNIKSQIDRYKTLGLSLNDSTLPEEVLKNTDRMREILELIIKQASSLKDQMFFALVEEAAIVRSALGKDEYDSNYWKELAEDMRDDMKNGKKTVKVVEETVPIVESTTDYTSTAGKSGSSAKSADDLITSTSFSKLDSMSNRFVTFFQSEKREEILRIDSIAEYAIKKVNPVYPLTAKSLNITGTVRVEFVVDETGKVAFIKRSFGPPILQTAAIEALRKWEFKPFLKDGRPVKAEGYVIFNFSSNDKE